MGSRAKPAAPRPATEPEITDKRLLRGARTRSIVLRRAVDVASLDGLGGISFGQLAADTGLSKAGIQTLFRTKQALQLAAVEHARKLYIEAVITPAWPAPRGLARLNALLDNWTTYAQTPLFAGGCFWGATLAEFDSHPGPVHDALFGHQQEWVEIIATQLRHAVKSGELAELDADLTAFQIDALLRAANTALRAGDAAALTNVRRIVAGLLTPA